MKTKTLNMNLFPIDCKISYEKNTDDTVNIIISRYGTISKFTVDLKWPNEPDFFLNNFSDVIQEIKGDIENEKKQIRESLKNQINLFTEDLETMECRICMCDYPLIDLNDDNVCSECIEHVHTCEECDTEFDDRETEKHETHDNMVICNECYENYYADCDDCREIYNTDTLIELGNHMYCPNCIDAHSTECVSCHELIDTNTSEYILDSSGDAVCQRCFDNYYTMCDNCGEIILSDYAHYFDDDVYCESCYENSPENCLHSYSFKPRPNFLNTENDRKELNRTLYFGKEIEIDNGNRTEFLNDFKDSEFADGEFVYLKTDGSLSDSGIEIVTHPLSYDYLIENYFTVKKLFKMALDNSYTSHNAETCGLHIHCNRNFFGDTIESVETGIANVIFLYEKFWSQIQKFSRRKNYSYCKRYDILSNSEFVKKDDPEIPKKLLKACKNNYDRYRAVNLQPLHTIEFRVFRGTLNIETFFASVQFTKNIMELSKQITDAKIFDVQFSDIIHFQEFDELNQYVVNRSIEV